MLVTAHTLYRDTHVEQFLQPGTTVVDDSAPGETDSFPRVCAITRLGVAMSRRPGRELCIRAQPTS